MSTAIRTGNFHWDELKGVLDTEVIGRIETYISLRLTWAGTHNMSGPKALKEAWAYDVPDAYAVAQCLKPNQGLYDVGSGSGVPGLLVGIMKPNQEIWLVEPRVKRVAFMRSAIHALGLKNVKLLRERWPINSPAGPCQVVSRAVVDPEHWPRLAAEGGAQVVGILRMLAANRPDFALDGFEHDATVEYEVADGGQRRVERWGRSIPQLTQS